MSTLKKNILLIQLQFGQLSNKFVDYKKVGERIFFRCLGEAAKKVLFLVARPGLMGGGGPWSVPLRKKDFFFIFSR